MAEHSFLQAYGYVGVSLLKHRIPYQGRLPAHMIELAWREVENRMRSWRPGIYQIFVYSLSPQVVEYQTARVVVKEDGSFTLRKYLNPLED